MAQILTQEEVDALRDAIKDGDELESGPSADEPQVKVVVYDFKRPQIASTDQFHALRLGHEAFSGSLRSALFSILKMPVEINLTAVDQLSYGEFVLSLSNPTFLALLGTNPDIGNVELEMNLPMVASMLDVLLGGDGSVAFDSRGLTVLEKDIMAEVMAAVMTSLKTGWSNIADIDFNISALESIPDYIQLTRPETPCLNVTFDVRLSGLTGVFTLCYPAYTIDAIFAKSEERAAQKKMMAGNKAEALKMRKALDAVPLEIRASIGPASISARQVIALKPGDIINLDRRINKPVDLYIENKAFYTAEIGQREGKAAIRLIMPRATDNMKKE